MMEYSFIPLPAHVETLPGHYLLDHQITLYVDHGWGEEPDHLQSIVSEILDVDVSMTTDQDRASVLILSVDHTSEDSEAYQLEIECRCVKLETGSPRGVVHGLQTLNQLIYDIRTSDGNGAFPIKLPCLKIIDRPRFRWRGFMLDVSRHIFPIEFLYKLIELLSFYKINIFHLHLSDDQGWRLEIERYPKLTQVGAWRSESRLGHRLDSPAQFDGETYGGFYTKAQISSLVEFAGRRNITIVPEIDMPGHAQAMIAAYPRLGISTEDVQVWTDWGVSEHLLNIREETFEFIGHVLDEVIELFPGPYIHLGGDEVNSELWLRDPNTQARLMSLGLNHVEEIYPYFINRVTNYVEERGRRVIGWDEILSGVQSRDTIVMSWRGFERGIAAANAGQEVVMTPNEWTYLDTYQVEEQASEPLAIGGLVTLEKAYSFEPLLPILKFPENVLGGQAQAWTEYMILDENVEYMVFPRLIALAEALWTPLAQRDFLGFSKRLAPHLRRLTELGVSYRTP